MVAEVAIPRLLKITLPAVDICYVLENFKTKKKLFLKFHKSNIFFQNYL